ncbi:hypothetical protein JCM14036_11300 [Desulfotomaculum defluvii]
MGKVTTALAIKFVMTFLASWVAVSLIAGNSWTWALLIAVIGTAVNYVLGDKFILPNYGNIVAAVSDGILSLGLLWLVDLISVDLRLNSTAYITFALLVMVGEYFFHNYLISTGKVEEKDTKV